MSRVQVNKFIVIGFLCFAYARPLLAAEWVDWRASGYLIPILQEAGLLKPSVSAQDWDLEASSCQAHVLRPSHGENPMTHADNAIVCTIHSHNGQQETARISLESFPIAFWGNRFTPKVFQIKTPTLTKPLFRAMRKLYKETAGAYPLDELLLAGPGEGIILNSYHLNVRRTPYSSSYLTCDGSWELNREGTYDLYDLFCVFHFPEDKP